MVPGALAAEVEARAVTVMQAQAADHVRLKVLCVIPQGSKQTSFVFSRRQVECVGQQGVDVETFFLHSRTNPRAVAGEWRRLRKVLRSFSPDVVHAHYGTVTSLLCAIVSQAPLVITFRGSDLVRAREVPRLRAWLGILCSQLSALFAHSIICTGDRLRDRLWWRKKTALVLPSGVNLGLFRPSPQAIARQALGWSPDQKVVLFNSGGLPLLKGRELAQQAVSIAENHAGPMRFVELKGEVPPDQMPLYLNAADCLVLASESEGSPNIVKEALACNLPIAAVDVGDVTERLRDVTPSRVVHRDAHELGMAIADILAQQKRSNGRNKAAEFADDRIASQLKIIYQAAARISRNGQQH